MQILIYFEDFVTELLTITAILSAIVLVICVIAITVSMCKNDKIKRQMYKEITQKSKNKNKNSKITLEL